MKGTIISINERAEQAVIKPHHAEIMGHITVETNLLIKYIRPGAHVKVVNGVHQGQTGKVVNVYHDKDDHYACIVTDGVNQEIQCDINYLQVSNEVTIGLNSLGGYELYDLVMLSANEYAVVVYVGTEHLKVLTQFDNEKIVRPVEIKGKKPPLRGTTGAFDHMKNPLCVGDTVSVVQGQHAGKTGTIKHINRSVLWLHANNYLKNSSIFVAKGKSCVLAGGHLKDAASTTAAVLNATYDKGAPAVSRGITSSGRGAGKDPMVGKSVQLTKGGFKGMLGHIVDATESHFWVELHGRLKKIHVPKDRVQLVGDRHGAVDKDGAPQSTPVDYFGVPSTPFLTAPTPLHGAQTPMHGGGETPNLGNTTPSGRDTPGRDDGNDVWRPNARDVDESVKASVSSVGAASVGWGGNDWMSPASASWGSDAGSSDRETEAEWERDFLVVFTTGGRLGALGCLMGRVRVSAINSFNNVEHGPDSVHTGWQCGCADDGWQWVWSGAGQRLSSETGCSSKKGHRQGHRRSSQRSCRQSSGENILIEWSCHLSGVAIIVAFILRCKLTLLLLCRRCRKVTSLWMETSSKFPKWHV
jgi:transcription elongation factor